MLKITVTSTRNIAVRRPGQRCSNPLHLIWFIWIPISYGNVKAILPGVHTTYLQCINAIYVLYNTNHVQIQYKTQSNTNRYTTQQYTDNTRLLPRSAVVCGIYISWCQYRCTYIMYIGHTIRTQVSIAPWCYIQCHWNSIPESGLTELKQIWQFPILSVYISKNYFGKTVSCLYLQLSYIKY